MSSPNDALVGPATPEILTFIFSIAMNDSWRPISTIIRFSLVCRYWKKVVDLSVVWRRGLWISPSEAAPIDTVVIPHLLEPHALHIRHLSFEGYPSPIPILRVLNALPQLLTLTTPFSAGQCLPSGQSSSANPNQPLLHFAGLTSRFADPPPRGHRLSFAPTSHILQCLELRCPLEKQDSELILAGLLSLLTHIPYLLELSLSADLIRDARELPSALLTGIASRCECLKVLRVDSDSVLESLREVQLRMTNPVGKQLDLHLCGAALFPIAPTLWRSPRHHLINSDNNTTEDEDEDEDEWEAVRPAHRVATPYPRFLRSQTQRRFRRLYEASFYNQYDIFCGRPLVFPILLPASDPRSVVLMEALLEHGALPHLPLFIEHSIVSGPPLLDFEQLHPELQSLFRVEVGMIPWVNVAGLSAVGFAILLRRWRLLPLLLKRWGELDIGSIILEKQISVAVERILESKHISPKHTILDLFKILLACSDYLPAGLDLIKLVLTSVKTRTALPDQASLEKLTLQLLDFLLRCGVRVRALSIEEQLGSGLLEAKRNTIDGCAERQSCAIAQWPTSPGSHIPFASFEGLPHLFYTDNFKVWEFLVSKGCDINAVDSPVTNRTLLHHKIYENSLPAVYWLLNNQGVIHIAFDPIRIILDSIRPGDVRSEEFAGSALKMFIIEGLLPRDKIPLTQVLSIKSQAIFKLLMGKDWIELPRSMATRRLLMQSEVLNGDSPSAPVRSSPDSANSVSTRLQLRRKSSLPTISPHLMVLLVGCFNTSAEFMDTLWNELYLSPGFMTSNVTQDYSSSSDEDESKPGIDYAAAPGSLQIPDGSTTLHVACQVCWKKYVFQFLIMQQQLDLHRRNMRGETPFLAACKAANMVAVRWLLYYRCKLNVKEQRPVLSNDTDTAPHHKASATDLSDSVSSAGSNRKSDLPPNTNSPSSPRLAEPLPPRLPNSPEALRAKSTLFSETDANGNTGLHLAVDSLSYSLVEFLCSNEFPVNVVNSAGLTPLDMCKTEVDDNAHWDKNIAMYSLLAAFYKLQTGQEPRAQSSQSKCAIS